MDQSEGECGAFLEQVRSTSGDFDDEKMHIEEQNSYRSSCKSECMSRVASLEALLAEHKALSEANRKECLA